MLYATAEEKKTPAKVFVFKGCHAGYITKIEPNFPVTNNFQDTYGLSYSCTICPKGQYNDVEGYLNDDEVCQTCPSGTYISAGDSSALLHDDISDCLAW